MWKQEGASKEDIDQLSKFKFRKSSDDEKFIAGDVKGPPGGIMTECGTDSPTEHVLSQEDALMKSKGQVRRTSGRWAIEALQWRKIHEGCVWKEWKFMD